eukprot:CAMPEP_0194271102 /NCGR_PEP_ID=MMETSP0169-20130528/4980_1 /TAXON_ID=218684 /ORGANISM="Corethron pennatum, Strain L29A3" /LENGTH=161 /DNA_ID=CAMNT_0039013379 /DNA_START=1 /DNA_END=487 /DNA_ORIENTATION=-
MELRWADDTAVNHAALRLQYGTTYRFDVGGDETVSVHRTKKVNDPSIALPGNQCGCASRGPLLFTPEPEMGLEKNRVILRSSKNGESTGGKLILKMCTDSTKFTLLIGTEKKSCKDLGKMHCDMKDRKSLKLYGIIAMPYVTIVVTEECQCGAGMTRNLST